MIESLYSARRIKENDFCVKDYDLFILGVNNEFRSSNLLRIMNKNQISNKKIVIQSHVLDSEIKVIIDSFQNVDIVDAIIYKDMFKRISIYTEIVQNFDFDVRSLAIDMTGLPIPDIYVILKVVTRKFTKCKVTIFYTEPYNYFYENFLFKNYKYSLGELNVIEIPGYNGSFSRSKENIMIFILGFEDKVSRHIYLHDEPSKIVAVNGFPASIQKFKDISVINNGILREINFEKLFYSDALNPFELYNTLDEITKKYGDANYTIVPLGSKPMALGAGLFQLKNSNIKIKYPLADSYTYNSSPNSMDSIWMYEIDYWG